MSPVVEGLGHRIPGRVEKGQRCQRPMPANAFASHRCREKAKAWGVFDDGKRALCYRCANELCHRVPMTLGELREVLARMPHAHDHEPIEVLITPGDVRGVATIAGAARLDGKVTSSATIYVMEAARDGASAR